MAQLLLSETDDWHLVHEDQDVRGWDLLDAQGLRIGQIADMVIDTDAEHVVEVVLTDGVRYPAADLDIEEAAVFLRAAATGAGRAAYPYAGLRPAEPIAGAETPLPHKTISGTDTATPATPGTISGAEAGDYFRHDPHADDDDADYETHFARLYSASGAPFTLYRPAYRFGSEMSLDQGYLGTSFEDVETSLRERWADAFPGLRYEDYRGAIRYGFERRRG